MSRIHLYMCSFLVSLLCSSSTTTIVSPSPSATVAMAAPTSNSTPSQAGQTAAVTPSSNETAIQSTATESVKVTNFSNVQIAPSSSVNVTLSTSVAPATPVPTTSSTKATKIWDKAIDLATPLGTFIIVVVAVALILILLIVLICVCCKYARLKKKTRFPEHMAINDSEWIRSSDDLLMWERNLRASEVKTTNGVSNRPVNDKRT